MMDISFVQSLKLIIIDNVGLSKDALHIYVGLGLYLFTCILFPHFRYGVLPLFVVFVAALVGEGLDMRDDLYSFGYWRWKASLYERST